MEMHCKPVFVKTRRYPFHSFLYGNVDVVSYVNGELWAWEYKSEHDSMRRGYYQLKNYARSFDRVCLATDASLSGKWYWKIVDEIGAGVYAEYLQAIEGCLFCKEPEEQRKIYAYSEVEKPRLQQPDPLQHDKLMKRFRHNVFSLPKAKLIKDHERLNRFLELQNRLQNERD